MSAKLAIDFGTCNTVVSVWDDATEDARSLFLPGYSCLFEHNSVEMPIVPSLIHYASDGAVLIGNQVLEKNLDTDPGTFTSIKARIRQREDQPRSFGNHRVSPADAGREFLRAVVDAARRELGGRCDEVAVTVPVGSFEAYQDWLVGSTECGALKSLRLLDEPVAAALGYGARVSDKDVYLVFDFGGGSLDVAVVLFENVHNDQAQAAGRGETAGSGKTRRPGPAGGTCRVLGKASRELGGMDIDRQLAVEVAKRNDKTLTDPDVAQVVALLVKECQKAKEVLSHETVADVLVMNPVTGAVLQAELTRAEFEELLVRERCMSQIKDTMRCAVTNAQERGYGLDDINRVLMVGGSSLIPCVQQLVRETFGEHRVLLNRPLDAVARGATRLLQGWDLQDFIRHEYAVEWRNPVSGQYDYRTVVKSGTPYPSIRSIDTIKVKGTQDGQTALQLRIFEISNAVESRAYEMYFDSAGQARLVSGNGGGQSTQKCHINEGNPTFLLADPPAQRGEARFEVNFSLDEKRRLLITAHDLRTGHTLYQHYPVIKLR